MIRRLYMHYILTAIVLTLLPVLVDTPVKDVNPVGSYISEDSLRVLILEEDGSYVLRSAELSERKKRRSMIYTPEHWTLSYGSWAQEGSFVVLNVSEDISGDFLEMQLTQRTTEADSMSFTFESPCISDEACRSQYLCEIWIIGSTSHPFDCRYFIISKNEVSYFPQFSITMTPQKLGMRPYVIQYNRLRSSSWGGVRFGRNEFMVALENFTPEYIYYIRFVNEYMPIDEAGNIYVRGERYTKMDE